MEGTKDDLGKPPIHLVPRSFIEGVALGFNYGTFKYEKWNWRKGLRWSRLGDAAMRHIIAFMDGEDIDEDSGLSHLDLAGCNIAMLKAHAVEKLGEDDRYKPEPTFTTSSPREEPNENKT